MKFHRNKVLAVVAGGAAVVMLGASGSVAAQMIGSKQIANNSIRSIDIKDGSLAMRDLNNYALKHLGQGNAASDVKGGLAAHASNDPATRTTIDFVGGTILNTQNRGVTDVTSITLEPGIYLVSAYGHFDRLNDTQDGYADPTTDTYGALALFTGDDSFSDFSEAAGTYFTGAISRKGFTEATASGSQILEVTETTTLHAGAFGYNEDRSAFGSTDAPSGAQFSVYATLSAVRVG